MSTPVTTTLLEAMVYSPLIAHTTDRPDLLHAVTMEDIANDWSSDNGFLAACGVDDVCLAGRVIDGMATVTPWPPRIRGLPDGVVRCRDCWVATGKKRPRVEWKANE